MPGDYDKHAGARIANRHEYIYNYRSIVSITDVV